MVRDRATFVVLIPTLPTSGPVGRLASTFGKTVTCIGVAVWMIESCHVVPFTQNFTIFQPHNINILRYGFGVNENRVSPVFYEVVSFQISKNECHLATLFCELA
jgi:hypothetical protein